MYKTINVSEEKGIYIISLNNPPLNILTIQMIKEITDALEKVNKAKIYKVLLIRGEGKCFSAGADVKEHMPEMLNDFMTSFHNLFVSLVKIEIPTISLVHNMALGGGLELASYTDLIFASESAKLGQPEIKLGVFAPMAVTYFPKLIGLQKSYELLLTGKTISAKEAKEIGLVNDVFPDDKLLEEGKKVADTIASYSLPVLVACKKAIRKVSKLTLEEALPIVENIYNNEVMKTSDAIEGLTSFLEKRKPVWKDK